MGVSAELNFDTRYRGGCEIGSLHDGRAAIEGKRRDPHSLVTFRDQKLKSIGLLLRDSSDRIARRDLTELSMAFQRNAFTERPTPVESFHRSTCACWH